MRAKDKKLTCIRDLVKSIDASRGKSRTKGSSGTGWPDCFTYHVNEETYSCEINFNKNFSKKNFRRLEPWAFSLINTVREICDCKISALTFNINAGTSITKQTSFKCNMEAFKRRISFLALNNRYLKINVFLNKTPVALYTQQELFNRPKTEIVRSVIGDRHDKDRPGRLEKDFQAFLFGKGLESKSTERTNERLAILGMDFYHLKRKGFKIDREFATGVFFERISQATQILPTEFVDIVTFNKYGDLALIELKLDDSTLEVISQLLDYALFFRCYIDQLSPLLEKRLGKGFKRKNIACYVANNHYHPRFDKILRFYKTDGKKYGFELRQLILGHTVTI
jgi:hypothetical protein